MKTSQTRDKRVSEDKSTLNIIFTCVELIIFKFLLDSDLGIPDPGRALVLLGGDGDLVGILDDGGGDSWDEKNLKYFLHEWWFKWGNIGITEIQDGLEYRV